RNWCPATYVGTLFWEGYESGCWKDHDYNFSLSTNSGAGLTCANNGMLGVEFDAQEVTDRAPDRWWAKLRKAVNEDVQRAGDGKPDYREARKLVDGHAAVITGLIGLDIEHTARTETHPVYAMAIETTAPDEPRALWALFARNWGNAGGCGGSQQYASFPDNHLRIRIPWRAGAASVEVAVPADPTQPPLPGDSWFATNITGSAVAPSFRIEPGKGVVVDFALPEPTEKGRFTGELHLRWVMPPSPRAIPGLTVQPAAVPRPLLPRALREHDEGLEGDLDILARDRELQRVLRSASPAALPRGSVTPSGVPGAVTSSGLGLSSLVCFCPNKSNVDQRRLPLVSDPGTPRRLLTPTRVTPRFEKEPNEERERFLSLPQVQRALKEAGARLRQRRSEQERHEH
ncbi:MAG: hypothetical protein K0Q72_5266, partial [Armatimonadetes bacterium]|nr:hypothetical protein [Armatimonadota bacterium]